MKDQLSKALAERGHKVSIYTSDFELDKEFIKDHKKIKVHSFKIWFSLPNFYFTPGIIFQARKQVKNFDIIHLQSPRSFQNTVVCHYAKKYGVPIILDAHGFPPNFGKPLMVFIKKVYDFFFTRSILKNASGFLAETKTGMEEFESYGVAKNKISLISPPRDLTEFEHLPPKGEFRKKFGIKEKNIIMFLGGIDYVKGIDFLIESFSKLAKSRDDAVLVIVGPDHGFKPELDKLVNKLKLKDKVIFTGPIFGKDKLSAIVDATIMTLPSRSEQGLPFSGLEAIMCNVPIIVSKKTGAGDDVALMDGGYLVDFGDVNQMVGIMQDILNNSEKAKEIVQKEKKYIEENFSMKKKIVDYENIYKRCINEKIRKSK